MVVATQRKKINIDARWASPGVSGIPGIDQSNDQSNMGDYGCYYAENVEPFAQGWGIYKPGVVKRNNSAPTTSKVQGIIGLGAYVYFVANGNFYRLDLSAGTVTLVSGGAGIFDSTARVRMVVNQGKSGTACSKIYACDGVSSDPRVFSSATNTISTFSLSGAWGTFTTPATVGVWQQRTYFTFLENSVDESRIIFSEEADGDNYDSSGTALSDPFDDYVWPGDGDYIVGAGTVQFKGTDAQKDALIICKSKRSFMGEEVVLSASERAITFNNNGVDIGAVSADAIVQFGNDLWILTAQGIKGFNAVLEGSGGVSSFSISPVSGLNRLVKQASENTAFGNSFAVHHSAKNKIRFFMPRSSATSTNQNGFTYPEMPMDYALCYGYDVLAKWEGNPRGEAYWARGGAGFAFSCACEFQGRLLMGDYFGNIYEMDCEDAGEDNIPLPGETDQVIYGEFVTPFMKFADPAAAFDSQRRVIEIILHGRSTGEVEYRFDLTYLIDKEPYEKRLPTLVKYSGDSGTTGGTWDIDNWDEFLWGSEGGTPNKIRAKPPGRFNAMAVRNWFPSKRIINGTYKPNQIWIYAVTGQVEVV